MNASTSTVQPVAIDADGMAIIRRTVNNLRGMRYAEGEDGNAAGTDGGAAAGAAGTSTTTDTTTGGTGATDTGAAATGGTDAPGKVEDLPSWAQKIISDTRSEAAKYRTGTETAAKNAEKALTDRLAVALGLKEDASKDPAALTESLTKAQEAQKATERRLAVFTAAADTKQAAALLNRNDFTSSIDGLDPSDSAAFAAAVKAAVEADPTLKAARAAGASTADTPGGSGEGQPITEAQLARMSNKEIADAHAAGKLNHLL